MAASGLTTQECLLLQLVDELVDTSTVSDAPWLNLARQWSAPQLVELVALVGYYHLVAFTTNAFRVPLEPFAARFAQATGTRAGERVASAEAGPSGSEQHALLGGCFCGFVRYEVCGAAFDRTLCHCTICRRTTGAPAVAWFSTAPKHFVFTAGAPGSVQSSEHGTRTFCPRCGTQLTLVSSREPEAIDVTTCSLDDPEAVPPVDHTWTRSQLSWMIGRDAWPRFDEQRK